MRVLYFLFDGFDTANGTNHLALTTMHTFLDNGIDVYLVTSHSKGIFPDIPDSLSNRKGFSYSIIQRNNVEKRNFIKRYFDGMKYAFNACKEWNKHIKEIDAVILQSTHTAFFSASLLHKKLRKPIIYNNFDMFPDGPFMFGAINNKFIFKALSFLQKRVYKYSSKIVVISEDMKQSFLNKGVEENKLVIIPNWYDSDVVKEVNENDNVFIKKYNIDRNKFIVQYAGNIGYTLNFSAFIEVAKLLKDEEDIEIHIIGTGGFENDFKESVNNERLNNIRFFPWQDSSVINDVYSSCDIEMVPLSKGVIYTSFPSKCTLLMACGRTFLCMCEKESKFYEEINNERVGICVDRIDYISAANIIKDLRDNSNKLNNLANRARVYGDKVYSSHANAKKYIDLVRNLVDVN
jgi:glycosyltransferase involved in cell wall biosynthesis